MISNNFRPVTINGSEVYQDDELQMRAALYYQMIVKQNYDNKTSVAEDLKHIKEL
jgi:hypothetical protein